MSEQAPTPSIADLNDAFRRSGQFLATPALLELPDQAGLFAAVVNYDDFDTGNDPYGEHDFGAFNWHEDRVFWKIDYTDPETGYWRDPLDPDCQRILTVMTAADY